MEGHEIRLSRRGLARSRCYAAPLAAFVRGLHARRPATPHPALFRRGVESIIENSDSANFEILAIVDDNDLSLKDYNFDGCTVDKIFIDDYPNGRNNSLITALVNTFGYKELYLHETNLGLSVTWTEFWKLIKDRGYDYVWHQEDDVRPLGFGRRCCRGGGDEGAAG